MEYKRFEGVVFDMDGVVIDTEKMVLECWNEVGMKHGLPDMTEVLKQCIGLNARDTDDLIRANFADFAGELDAIKEVKKIMIRERVDNGQVPPKPGVIELLTYLKDKGYKTALATSTSRKAATHELDILDLTKFFDVMVTGDEIAKGKPDPEIFLTACDKLGVSAEKLIGVEDSYNGIKSCKAAGLYTVMVPDLLPPTDEIRDLADEIFDSIITVKKILG